MASAFQSMYRVPTRRLHKSGPRWRKHEAIRRIIAAATGGYPAMTTEQRFAIGDGEASPVPAAAGAVIIGIDLAISNSFTVTATYDRNTGKFSNVKKQPPSNSDVVDFSDKSATIDWLMALAKTNT